MAKVTETAKKTQKIMNQRKGIFIDLVAAIMLAGVALIMVGMG